MGLWSNTLSLLFLPSLLQGSLPTGGISPLTSPKCILPQGCSSSWTAPPWVPSSGVEPFRMDCSSMDPPQGHKSCQQNLYSSILHRPDAARSLLQHRLTDFLRHPHALVWDPPHPVGGDLLHHRPPLGHPASSWSGPWAAMESQLQFLKYHFPFLLHCPWVQSCFSHISLPSLTPVAITQGFFPFLKRHYLRGTTTVTDGLSIGQWQAQIGTNWTFGKFSAASHRSHPCSC